MSDRTNQIGTCLFCGTKLSPYPYPDNTDQVPLRDYADNAFCRMRCAQRFGQHAARLGFRLQARTGVPEKRR